MFLVNTFPVLTEFIPNQEFYDKVVAAIKADSPASRKEKTTSKKETMSDVSRRYF